MFVEFFFFCGFIFRDIFFISEIIIGRKRSAHVKYNRSKKNHVFLRLYYVRCPTALVQNLSHFRRCHSRTVSRIATRVNKKKKEKREKRKMNNERPSRQHVCSLSGPEVLATSVVAHFPAHPITTVGEVEILWWLRQMSRHAKYYNMLDILRFILKTRLAF